MNTDEKILLVLQKIEDDLHRIATEMCRQNDCLSKIVGQSLNVNVTGEVRTR